MRDRAKKNRILMSFEGWLRADERWALHDMANDVPYDGVIINIGVEKGASVNCLRVGNPYATIIGIDIDTSKYLSKNPFAVAMVEADSGGEALDTWRASPRAIDLLFIDGDHSFNGIMRDLGWLEFLKVGCIVAFHDCWDFDDPDKVHELCPGVNEAVQDWIDNEFDKYQELESIGTMRIFVKTSE